tara:strand:+ start:500 stop:829 length:330 start_codon:yes stop_codon:yes gene_type:complete
MEDTQDDLAWLLEQKPKVHQVTAGGRTFYMREPTAGDRDRFDTMVASMDLSNAQLRSPMVSGVLCNQAGHPIGQSSSFDDVPSWILEPLVDKAKELYGLTDSPTEGDPS